ncbi:MAG: PCMD domain-containing protein [Prevotella sp.]|nr:PCMD domain-containing protein [Prevotella sp.]
MGKRLELLLLMCCLLCTSCFKDEPLNDECDIESAYVHVDDVNAVFYSAKDTLVSVLYTSDKVVFNVRRTADVKNLAPVFKITDGATIQPANGSVQDFTNPVTYTVTSQDGRYKRTYTVEFVRQARMVSDVLKFDFENYRPDSKFKTFYEWFELDEDGKEWPKSWANGNIGYGLTGGGSSADAYPTTVLKEGYDGAALKLVTLSTGALGAWAKKYIAAGNLFLGEFNLALATTEPLKSTRFGVKFGRKPIKMTGYYQYKPGSPFKDAQNNDVAGRIDKGDVYAVFFRNEDENGNEVVLYGDDVLTNKYIVAKARIENMEDTKGEWKTFEIPFVYDKEIDLDLLDANGYSLTVCFSSSIDGATFEGAIGSTLLIDKVRIECEEEAE